MPVARECRRPDISFLYARLPDRLPGRLVRGGTPSQLAKEDFEAIFSHIYKAYKVIPDAEITLEATGGGEKIAVNTTFFAKGDM